MHGRIRKPFRLAGRLWTQTGNTSLDGALQAYRLMPEAQFDGESTTYHKRLGADDGGEAARADPMGAYHGVRVTFQGKAYVLYGPPERIIVSSAPPDPMRDTSGQGLLFDL